MQSLFHSFKLLYDSRLLSVFVLGFAQGFPFVLHGSVLTLWMQSEGLSRSAIGYIGIVATVYALKWMWSPLIDRVRLPFLFRYVGQYRAWILLTQALLVVATLMMSTGDPQGSLVVLGLFALGVATASATQDIAIDAYRILLFTADEIDTKQPYCSAMITAGWWAGYGFIGGTLALWLGGETIGLTWPQVYLWAAGVFVALMIAVVFMPEQARSAETSGTVSSGGFSVIDSFRRTVVAPFADFFARCGFRIALGILLFLPLFRVGEAILGRMSLVFYVELGFTTEDIALYQKFVGGIATALFAILGAAVNTRFGVIRGLLVGGIAMASANLLYAVMAYVGPEPWLLVVVLIVDNFCNAFATVAVLSFMAYFTSRTYTGTQFALMVAASNFGRTTVAASSGAIVDAMDGNWSLFFVFTTLSVIPSLLLLVWMSKLLEEHKAAGAQAASAQ
jgi:PAT family beta-lactamase induction signal transducer AmpG